MSNYGINISKPGYDVSQIPISSDGIQVANPFYAAFSTSWFLFKIVATGTVTMNIATTAVGPTSRLDTSSIAHGQPVIPQVACFFSVDGGTTWRGNNGGTTGVSSNPVQGIWISADSTNVIINVFNYNVAAYTATIRYVIYADQGS